MVTASFFIDAPRRLSWSLLLLLTSTFQPPLSTAQQGHTDEPHSWTYAGEAGPEYWADLSPEFKTCASGKRQSPIDIRGVRPAALPEIRFSYTASPLTIIDNGHTIQINYARGSTIGINAKTYELVQIHFHHPSEEKIVVWDACLSFLSIFMQVERRRRIRVRYQNLKGETLEFEAGDERDLSELLQHEIDHLDGILTIDRVVDVKTICTREEFEKRYRKNSPYAETAQTFAKARPG